MICPLTNYEFAEGIAPRYPSNSLHKRRKIKSGWHGSQRDLNLQIHKRLEGTKTDLLLQCNLPTMLRTGTSLILQNWGTCWMSQKPRRPQLLSHIVTEATSSDTTVNSHRFPRFDKCRPQDISCQRKMSRDTAATCANFGGPDPASFRGWRATVHARPAQ